MLESANLVLQGAAILLLFLGFAFGTATIVVGYILSKRQAVEVAEANKVAAGANERAADANKTAGEANERAAAANKLAEGFRLDIATANEGAAKANALAESFRLDIAKANERAAAANETAEKERLARLQLEARLADRVITDAQAKRLITAFAALKGKTVDVGMFGDNLDIANVNGAILRCLASAGVRVQTFAPLGGGGGVRGVLVAADPNASVAIKAAAQSAVNILRETLGGGVALMDFAQLKFDGSAMTGNSEGAEPRGSGPVRIWIGPK